MCVSGQLQKLPQFPGWKTISDGHCAGGLTNIFDQEGGAYSMSYCPFLDVINHLFFVSVTVDDRLCVTGWQSTNAVLHTGQDAQMRRGKSMAQSTIHSKWTWIHVARWCQKRVKKCLHDWQATHSNTWLKVCRNTSVFCCLNSPGANGCQNMCKHQHLQNYFCSATEESFMYPQLLTSVPPAKCSTSLVLLSHKHIFPANSSLPGAVAF